MELTKMLKGMEDTTTREIHLPSWHSETYIDRMIVQTKLIKGREFKVHGSMDGFNDEYFEYLLTNGYT